MTRYYAQSLFSSSYVRSFVPFSFVLFATYIHLIDSPTHSFWIAFTLRPALESICSIILRFFRIFSSIFIGSNGFFFIWHPIMNNLNVTSFAYRLLIVARNKNRILLEVKLWLSNSTLTYKTCGIGWRKLHIERGAGWYCKCGSFVLSLHVWTHFWIHREIAYRRDRIVGLAKIPLDLSQKNIFI